MRSFVLRHGLTGALLCLGAFAVFADTSQIERSAKVDTQLLQKDFQQIKRRIGQLQQTTVQATQTQLGQSDAIKQKIGSIELGQKQLDNQLQTLHGQNLQQIDDLKTANRQLRIALWTLAGIVVLLLGVLWRLRKSKPTPDRLPAPAHTPTTAQPNATKPLPMPPAPPVTAASEISAEAKPEPEPEQVTASETAPVPPEPTAPPELPPPSAASWSTLVAADLHSTEQAFAQGREGFMQPARTDS